VRLQILHVPDCPNVAVLAARLDEVLAGRVDVEVEQRVVADQDEAGAAGMTGSPTLLVDGTDPFAVPDRAQRDVDRQLVDVIAWGDRLPRRASSDSWTRCRQNRSGQQRHRCVQ
jgi:hypothetical protein